MRLEAVSPYGDRALAFTVTVDGETRAEGTGPCFDALAAYGRVCGEIRACLLSNPTEPPRLIGLFVRDVGETEVRKLAGEFL